MHMSYNYIVNREINDVIVKEVIVRGSEDNGTHVSVVSPLESWQSHVTMHQCWCI